MLVYEYRRALDEAVRQRAAELKDKLVTVRDHQEADVLRGRIQEAERMTALHQEVIDRFLADDGPDEQLPEQ